MLKCLSGGRSLCGAVSEECTDERLAVLGDRLPCAVFEAELSLFNLLHDLLVGLTIEGRHARKKDESDNTARPQIALLVVVLVKNLGGNVVGSSELLIKGTVGIVNERGTEVNNLDLVELFVLLEQDVFWLKITMHNVGLMTVVDAGKNLLHENSSISLAELASLEDLVEEFTTLADLCDQVVALIVLEELIHFDDVGVILKETINRVWLTSTHELLYALNASCFTPILHLQFL